MLGIDLRLFGAIIAGAVPISGSQTAQKSREKATFKIPANQPD